VLLFIRSLFNDTSCISDCFEPNDSVILNNGLRRAWKEVVVASTIRHLSGTTDITNSELKIAASMTGVRLNIVTCMSDYRRGLDW
jgi:hypothetical protein